jgi:short-subunit dehydrogenase
MNSKKSVLITGASSGIGKACALYLDELGYKVYAGVRKQSDGDNLKKEASERLTPLILDVTDENSINMAAGIIEKETGGNLYGLINNAGVSLNGPLELLPMSDIQKLMDVNVTGLLAVTKAFLPIIRKNKGRIVNISSGHGLLAIPDKSVYAASKFAVQAISDSLRVELRPFGVSVSTIVVGKVNTEVLSKILVDRQKMIESADIEVAKLYSTLIEFFDKEVKNIPGIEAIEAAKVISKALSNKKPKAEYFIGPGAIKMKKLAGLPRKLREWMMYKAIYK